MAPPKLLNLSLIKNKYIRNEINGLFSKMWRLFIRNNAEGGMIFNFFKYCVDGQILISLKKDDKNVHSNTLHDFYIDDRVGFKGIKEVKEIIKDIETVLFQIVKRDKPSIVVDDIVRRQKYTGNITLDKYDISKSFRVMKIMYDLDPHYFGYEIVDTDLKPFKKNWIYAGNDDLEKITRR